MYPSCHQLSLARVRQKLNPPSLPSVTLSPVTRTQVTRGDNCLSDAMPGGARG